MARILVIEDNRVLWDLVFTYLTGASYDVLTAANGLEGVAVLVKPFSLQELGHSITRLPTAGDRSSVQKP